MKNVSKIYLKIYFYEKVMKYIHLNEVFKYKYLKKIFQVINISKIEYLLIFILLR